MQCFHPVTAYRSKTGRLPTGRWPIVFSPTQGYQDKRVDLRCGYCIGCRVTKATDWGIRCVHEIKDSGESDYLTLTYNQKYHNERCAVRDENDTIVDCSLNREDLRLFIKRLRTKFGKGVRYLACGEYGEDGDRPHFHVCMLNKEFKDKLYFKMSKGKKLYVSKQLGELWTYGFHTIGEVTFRSAQYVAKYITKKVYGDRKEEYYDGVQEEFCTMSRRPGLGYNHFMKYYRDYYPHGMCIIDGKEFRLPVYYDKLMESIDRKEIQLIKDRRREKAKKNYEKDGMFDRLQTKEQIAFNALKRKKRKLEEAKNG